MQTKLLLSDIAKKQRADQLSSLKAKITKKIAEQIQNKKAAREKYTPPRYDDIFQQGVAWLNSLDKQDTEEQEY